MAYSFATVSSRDLEERHLNFLRQQNEQVGPIADIAHRNLLQMAQPPPQPAFGGEGFGGSQGFQPQFGQFGTPGGVPLTPQLSFQGAPQAAPTPTLGGIAEAFAPPAIGPQGPIDIQQQIAQGGQIARDFAQQAAPQDEVDLTNLGRVLDQHGVTPEELTWGLTIAPNTDELARMSQSFPKVVPPEKAARVIEAIDDLNRPSLGETFASAPGKLASLGAAAITAPAPVAEKLEPLGDIPVVGGSLEREANFLASPLGVAAAPFAPLEFAAGAIGAVGLGAVGEATGIGENDVKIGGVTVSVQTLLEVAGGLTPGAALSAPGRTALTKLRAAGVTDDVIRLEAGRVVDVACDQEVGRALAHLHDDREDCEDG